MAHPPIDHGNGGGGGLALAPVVDLAAGVASILSQIAVGAEGHTSIASHCNVAEIPRRWRLSTQVAHLAPVGLRDGGHGGRGEL